ncbi:MAG: chemotaxis-specific protein-glutamate methyltransferase CheB [Deltaproteobacteria bacterium]|nr:chemotaxis-specific protein-glutamate methyltransferase CheB [Deltaproteobacteria bacterium]
MPLRIAIVHHDASVRNVLWKVIAAEPDYIVAWMVGDGAEAMQHCRRDMPDLILVDLALPHRDGVKVTCDIMKSYPCAILILADAPNQQAGKVFEAMGCGALDAVAAPRPQENGSGEGANRLLKKIATLAKILGKSEQPLRAAAKSPDAVPAQLPFLVAIGSSTGGPKALAAILSAFPADLAAAIIIIQHVDLQFASGLSDWLSSQTPLAVRLAYEGMRPLPGTVLVAATNDHLIMGADLAFHYTAEPRDYPYRPSVNALFESLNKFWPRKDVAVLLTGMGRDGGIGMAALKKAGWHTITQDEKTSIVYGMPAAAVELGGATEILPLDRIAGAILKRVPARPAMKRRQ